MKKILQPISILTLFVFTSHPVFSQCVQRQSLPGVARTFSAGFTINNTIYLMCGYDGSILYNDVWAYDPVADTWLQKANFPGGNRASCTAFAIGNKGYMGTGADGNVYRKDFWEYDPQTDTWTQKADFPGYEREEAIGFSIGNKGYLGMGQTFIVGPNQSWTTTYPDFYEYDPATDSWTQKDSLPGPSRAYAAGTALGNKGYIGLGGNDDQSASYNDFYEYDPVTDQWTQIASMGGSGRADAGIVASGNNIYVIGGINFPSFSCFSSCRMYDVISDTWTTAPGFTPGIIIAPVVQNVNGRVFAGTGYDGNIVPRNDWYEFTSLPNSVTALETDQTIVFPNPFTNELNITFENYKSDYSIKLFDTIGSRVYSSRLSSQSFRIFTSHLSKGIYFMKIVDLINGQVIIKKIIKE